MKPNSINIVNKKATFNFTIEQKYTAGIVLTGSEIKSIRNNHFSFNDAYCAFENNIFYLINFSISEFKEASYNNHSPLRNRILLLNKKELQKLSVKLKDKGYTAFPLSIFTNEKGFVKFEIAIGRGKKLYDKRHDIKEKDLKRDRERS